MGSFVATGRGVIGGDISGWMSWSGGVSCHTQKKCIKKKKKSFAWCRKKLLCGTQSSTKTQTNMSTLKQRGKTVTSLPYVLFDWTVQRSPATRIWATPLVSL